MMLHRSLRGGYSIVKNTAAKPQTYTHTHTQLYRLADSDRNIYLPRGLAIIVMKEGYLELVMEYKDRLESFMEELEKSGQWKQLERTVVSNYSFGQNGLIFVYKVLQSGFKPIISKFI